MAGVNISNIGLLKLNYENTILECLAAGARAFKDVKTTNWEGDMVDFRLHTAKNHAMEWMDDGGAFPTPDKQDYTRVRIGRRFWGGKLQISNGALAAARSTKGAFKSVVGSEVKNFTQNSLDFWNRFYFRDGTGRVGLVKGAASPSSGTISNVPVDDVQLLWPGATYEFLDDDGSNASLGTAVLSNVEVALNGSGYALANFTGATFSTALASGDHIFWKNAYNTAGNADPDNAAHTGTAISGLDKLIGTGNLQDVDVSTVLEYISYVDSNGGTNRDLTPQILRRTLATMKQKMGNRKAPRGVKAYSNAYLLQAFEEMYEGAYRLQSSDKSLGFEGASFMTALGRVDLEVDADCPRHKMFIVDPTQLEHRVQKKIGFEREPGGGIFRQSHATANVTAVMTCISQMAIKDRRSSAKIVDLSDDATQKF